MLLCAALKFQLENLSYETILPCRRHGEGYHILHDLGIKHTKNGITEGFIDVNGNFYNRQDAFDYARSIDQLSKTVVWHKQDEGETELYSEDLY